MSPNGYAKIERGQSSINLDKLQQIDVYKRQAPTRAVILANK